MSRTVSTYRRLGDSETHSDVEQNCVFDSDTDPPEDAAFGSPERRRQTEKKLLQKLDLRVAFLVLVYIMNYMDRNNVAAARLKGLEEDLGMMGEQFNTLVSILYAGYVLMQIPSNIFLNQITRPSVYISFCIFLWGFFSISTGAASSFHSALVSRFFLGFAEAVYYPGILFMLTRWYKRDELGLRMAYFTCGSSLGNAFGSLIASGVLTTMNNRLGYAAWRWLFFIEGVVTCILAVVALYIVPDFPTTPASWLTAEERMLAQQRLEEDPKGVERDPSKSVQESGLVEALTDWTVWWLAIALTALNAALSFGPFFPILAATMGYDPTVTLLLCSPPWIVGVTTSFIIMRRSDATGNRFWYITCPLLMGVIGFALAISTMNTAIRYLSLFFMAQATVSYIVLLAWVSNSIESSSKRAVAMAFINTCASAGNIGASYLWLASWGPSYAKSYAICILMCLIAIMMLWVYRLHLVHLNNKAASNERALGLAAGFRYFT